MLTYTQVLKERYGESTAYRFWKEGEIEERSFVDIYNDVKGIKSFLLKEHGERKVMGILGETSYYWVTTCLGIYNSNNITLSLDRNLLIEELCDIINFSEVNVLFVSRTQSIKVTTILEKCHCIQKVYVLEESHEFMAHVPYERTCTLDEAEVGHLLFTSGTTSNPKGVMLSYRNIKSLMMTEVEHEIKRQVLLSVLPIHHCYELLYGNLHNLYIGDCICICDKVENIIENMAFFKPTSIAVVPLIATQFYSLLKRVGKEQFVQMTGGALKNIIIGGASISNEVVKYLTNHGFKCKLGYGLSETCSACFSTDYTGDSKVVGNIHKPFVKDTQIKLTDEGELLIKAPHVMMGYLKNEAETNKVLKDGWLYTGDIASVDEEGNVRILGRNKNIIILENGKNIYPEELEGYLAKIKEIDCSMVYEHKNRIAAALYIKTLNEEKEAFIRAQVNKINQDLPSYKKIVELTFTSQPFPMTTTSKVKRKILLERLTQSKEEKKEIVLPTTANQVKIYNIIRGILDRSDFGINDNLFDIGLNSLNAFEIATTLGIDVQGLYENQTILAIENLLSQKQEDYSNEIENNTLIRMDSDLLKDKEEETYLLTGATGFLGSYVLRELLEAEKKVVCLVRNKEKLEKMYAYYFGMGLPEQVKTVIGDIEIPHLGLDETEYLRLINEIDSVIHTAANVHHIGKYETFYKTNVEGTKNVIEFCKAADATLHHISSYSVSGVGVVKQNSTIPFDENMIYNYQNYKDNVYVRTKYEAEVEILKERQKGLQANIYRVGSLSWAHDGTFQINAKENGLLSKLRGFLKSKICMQEELWIDLTPIDECAAALRVLIVDEKINNIYHLFNPNVITYEMLGDLYGLQYKKEDITVLKDMIHEDKDIEVYHFYTQLALMAQGVSLRSQITNKILLDKGFRWTKIDKAYLDLMLGNEAQEIEA